MNLGRQWEPEPANSPDVVNEYFMNKFRGWTNDMTEMLQSFTKIVGEEKDEDGAGLNAAKDIKEELYSRKDNILQFATVSHLHLSHLNEFLFSTDLNPPIVDLVRLDEMEAPLSHYFIHTSLNSFFTGNTLFRGVSDVPIIDALKQGVRVIELDLWPCDRDGICVKRRWTWETLEFQKCLDAIKEHAFTATRTYPVIITFKERLTPHLQCRATEMINQTLEHMVYHHHPTSSQELLSPAQLQNKIIITRRPPKDILYAKDVEVKVDVKEESRKPLELVDPTYHRLLAFHVVEPAGMLLEALTKNAKKIQRQRSYETDVIRFTQERFLRTRLKSKSLIHGSYKPQRGWMYGAQMIAISKQEYNKALWLMQGMFRANGGCGYVKKPEFLLNAYSSDGVFYPVGYPLVKKTLKVKVYMGDGWYVDFKKHLAQLSNFCVTVSIAGVPRDERKLKTRKSNNIPKTKEKNSEWIPIWGDDEFTFPLTYPELALLSIEVYDHNPSSMDGFAGQTCLPVSELRQGIRAVPLYDEKGQKCKSTMLLMRFKLY